MNLFNYKGYYGDAHCDTREHVLHGKIQFIRDLVTYEAETLEALEEEFKEAVDDYLETCRSLKKEPSKPFKGSFNVRISPELHRKAAVRALMASVSLNEWVSEAIQTRLEHVATQMVMKEVSSFSVDTVLPEKKSHYVTPDRSAETEARAQEACLAAANEEYASAA